MQHSLLEYIHSGGLIMYILVALNVIGITTILWKFIQFKIESGKAEKVVDGLIDDSLQEHKVENLEDLEADIFIKASKYLLSCERGLSTIKIIASIAPILGLLGTVLGVLESFETIAATGFSSGASAFASGISMALITTAGGLIVALPHYVGYNYLMRGLTELESKYEALVVSRITREKIS